MLFRLLDDAEHHYESLYSIQQQRCNNDALQAKTNEECTLSLPSRDYRKFRDNPEVYDSFDDSDEEGSKSNIDVPNTKLPDVPCGSQQGKFYAFSRIISSTKVS